MLAKKIFKFLKNIYKLLYSPSQGILIDHGVNPHEAIPLKGNKVHIKRINVTIETPAHNFVLESLGHVIELHSLGALFCMKNDCIHFTLGEYQVLVKTSQDILILHEIFWKGDYNYNCINDVIVCDIGMNVAFASIYFAYRDNVKAVYGFEPFLQTYEDALKNIELNPKIKNKIKPYNYGISSESKEVVSDYNYDNKASVNVCGLPNWLPDGCKTEKVNVYLKSIDSIFEIIDSDLRKSGKLLLKMDCEGSEYEIIRKLDEKKLLGLISCMIIEWHLLGSEAITDILIKYGYFTISRYSPKAKYGMIYAFNKSI